MTLSRFPGRGRRGHTHGWGRMCLRSEDFSNTDYDRFHGVCIVNALRGADGIPKRPSLCHRRKICDQPNTDIDPGEQPADRQA